MKRLLPLRLFIISAIVFICAANPIYSATMTSAQTGLFSVGSTWVGGVAPADGDNIVIATGHTITLDVSPKVMNITIESGATLDNSTFDLSIEQAAPGGNPIYTNNGIHNGTGNLLAYDGGPTQLSGNGATNCTIVIRSFGLEIINTCNLTITGNVQHAVPGNAGMNSKAIIDCPQLGGTLTINGNIITDGQFANVGIYTVATNGVIPGSTIIVNGNVSMLGSTDAGSGASIVNLGTINISGSLTLGPWASYCQNDGSMIIGGDLLGSGFGDSYFWNGLNATVKLGGNVFPDPFGGLFFAIAEPIGSSSTEPNTIEYNGVSAQTIRVPDDAAFSNLIINNSAGATMNLPTTVNGFLTIKPGATLTDASGSLAVTGALTLQCDATGTGSLITSAATTADVERYIAGSVVATHGWHLLSSPVAAQAISIFHIPGSGDDFYKWDEPTTTWINRTATGGGLNGSFETDFAVGTGYLIANATTSTKTFTGLLNVSNVAVNNLSYTGSNAYTGWHLLGNPFSSAIQWNDGNWALSNVDANCQIWNEASASYSVIAANGIIPVTNGFMVHASVNNASLTIPIASRVVSSANWYKNVEQNNQIVLTVNDPEGQTAQPTIIQFDANASEGYDNQYDSYFLTGFAPVFYSRSQQEIYALNTLPGITKGMSIPLGFMKNASNQFNIELTENISGQTIYLTDNKTNQTVLLNDGNYAFTAEDGDNADRFVIQFGVVGVGERADDAIIQAWYANGQLYIQNTNQTVQMNIYDIQGRSLQSAVINTTGIYSQAMNLPSGVYMVRLQNSLSVNTVKIIVR